MATELTLVLDEMRSAVRTMNIAKYTHLRKRIEGLGQFDPILWSRSALLVRLGVYWG